MNEHVHVYGLKKGEMQEAPRIMHARVHKPTPEKRKRFLKEITGSNVKSLNVTHFQFDFLMDKARK